MSSGILGINARNLLFIRPYNKKKAIRLADDKLKTKHFLSARGIPVPRLYAQIRTRADLEKFDFSMLPDSFVLKPNLGYGGEGIVPIITSKDDSYITASGESMNLNQMNEHIQDILDGRFALTNMSDIAFFEQRIVPDEKIGKFSYQGLPDIRIVVYNLIPVMAMLRLSTKQSKGRANLHQGAIGVGIDMARGEATYIAQGSRIIDEVPGMGDIRKLKIPFWDDILMIASKVQLITNLGYLAVDIVLDKNSGPLLLEINARAGLGVQIANLAPLRRRLERIHGLRVNTPEKGVRLAKDMFGDQVERTIRHMSGKPVIGAEEIVEIILEDGIKKVMAKIDPGHESSVLDESFAQKYGLVPEEGKKKFKLKYVLKGVRIQTAVEIKALSDGDEHSVRLGRRDLVGFLIDPAHKLTSAKLPEDSNKKQPIKRMNFFEIDRKIVEADKKIALLHLLRPANLSGEINLFLKDQNYNPQFVYRALGFEPFEIRQLLDNLSLDDSPLGLIYSRKVDEILNKVLLLEARGSSQFQDYSENLFGMPKNEDFELASTMSHDYSKNFVQRQSVYSAKQAARRFEEVFRDYDLRDWKVKFKEQMVTSVAAGKNNVLFVKKEAKFSKKRLEALIVHEIETHILTAENGKRQPYNILNRGTANYLKTQEGLAVYNQEVRTGNLSASPVAVLAVFKAKNSSFCAVYKFLEDMGISHERALKITLRVKRGFSDTSQPGAFTKDWIYFKGLHDIKKFVAGGGDLKRLYIGKVSLDDLEIIEQISGLTAPAYLPFWL